MYRCSLTQTDEKASSSSKIKLLNDLHKKTFLKYDDFVLLKAKDKIV